MKNRKEFNIMLIIVIFVHIIIAASFIIDNKIGQTEAPVVNCDR